MASYTIGNLHVNAPDPVDERTRVLYCPRCKCRRRVRVRYYEWYGPSARCTYPRRRWKNVIEPCNYQWRFE